MNRLDFRGLAWSGRGSTVKSECNRLGGGGEDPAVGMKGLLGFTFSGISLIRLWHLRWLLANRHTT